MFQAQAAEEAGTEARQRQPPGAVHHEVRLNRVRLPDRKLSKEPTSSFEHMTILTSKHAFEFRAFSETF